MSFSFLIVDDEELSRSYIHNLLMEFEPSSTIQEAGSAKVAKSIIETENIDVLFLDIRMSDTDGFGLLNSLSNKTFEVIFITAYNQYAINAIKEGAFDYLLKPVKKSDFKDTLNRLIKKRSEKIGIGSGWNDNSKDYLSKKLTLHHQKGITFITLKEIVYLKADNSYTTVHLINRNSIIVSKSIARFETALEQPWFFRIHKSYILNTSYLKEYISTDGSIALMNNGERIYVSRHRLSELLNLIEQKQDGLKI